MTATFKRAIMAIEELNDLGSLQQGDFVVTHYGDDNLTFKVVYDRNGATVSFQRVGTLNVYYTDDDIPNINAIFQ